MHNAETLREYCIAKEDSTEGFPFGEETLVFKVNNKMFCLMALDSQPLSINVKCDPDIAEELRAAYDAVQPGYHMNKKLWNTVIIDGTIPDKKIKEFIDWSYELVNSKVKNKK